MEIDLTQQQQRNANPVNNQQMVLHRGQAAQPMPVQQFVYPDGRVMNPMDTLGVPEQYFAACYNFFHQNGALRTAGANQIQPTHIQQAAHVQQSQGPAQQAPQAQAEPVNNVRVISVHTSQNRNPQQAPDTQVVNSHRSGREHSPARSATHSRRTIQERLGNPAVQPDLKNVINRRMNNLGNPAGNAADPIHVRSRERTAENQPPPEMNRGSAIPDGFEARQLALEATIAQMKATMEARSAPTGRHNNPLSEEIRNEKIVHGLTIPVL